MAKQIDYRAEIDLLSKLASLSNDIRNQSVMIYDASDTFTIDPQFVSNDSRTQLEYIMSNSYKRILEDLEMLHGLQQQIRELHLIDRQTPQGESRWS